MVATYFLTRGHMDHVERWERSMRSLWFPFSSNKKVTDEAGRKFDMTINEGIDGQLRPIQFWEFVCPDKFKEPLWNSLGLPSDETYFDTGPKEEGTGNSFVSGFGIQGFLTALRLGLKAKKFPTPDKAQPLPVLSQPIYRQHVNILGIGWRPDEQIETTMGKHEAI